MANPIHALWEMADEELRYMLFRTGIERAEQNAQERTNFLREITELKARVKYLEGQLEDANDNLKHQDK